MHPAQRCTVASVAGHAMYERSNPYFEHVAGGTLDMSECRYEQVAEKTTRITGARFLPAPEFRVKLEGAGKVGERYVGMVGIRDPYTIAHVDEVIALGARQGARALRRRRATSCTTRSTAATASWASSSRCATGPAHELCILVQGVAPTAEMAEEVCMIGTRQMFYARLPDVKGSAGSVAFALDEVLRASPAYRWTLNHTLRCDDPLELFPTHMTTAACGRDERHESSRELAKTIRSKNAGVDQITFDIIFTRPRDLRAREARAGADARDAWRSSTAFAPERIADFVEFDPGNAIKFTIYRLRPSGSPGDPDIFGAQQYAPLLDIEVPG